MNAPPRVIKTDRDGCGYFASSSTNSGSMRVSNRAALDDQWRQ
jgi:hypothetical protein